MDNEVTTGALVRECLEDDTPENRVRVAALFASLGPENEFGVLQEILWAEEEKREKRSTVAYLALQIAVPALLFVLLAGGWPIPIVVAFLLSLLGPPFLAARLYSASPAPARERRALERMAQMTEVRAAYHLLTSRRRLRPGDPLRQTVDDGLARLLPRLTPETAGVLCSQCDVVWHGLGDSVIMAARGRPRESPNLNRAILRAFGNARPPLARSVLTSVANARADADDTDAEALRTIAANYLLALNDPVIGTNELAAAPTSAPAATVAAAAAETPTLVRQVM